MPAAIAWYWTNSSTYSVKLRPPVRHHWALICLIRSSFMAGHAYTWRWGTCWTPRATLHKHCPPAGRPDSTPLSSHTGGWIATGVGESPDGKLIERASPDAQLGSARNVKVNSSLIKRSIPTTMIAFHWVTLWLASWNSSNYYFIGGSQIDSSLVTHFMQLLTRTPRRIKSWVQMHTQVLQQISFRVGMKNLHVV